ncbi:cytochrome c3 family protein [Pseudomarimonas arenosa]|uniref:FHA domain-containing protein n=1 Tax=Pseudomarimonas arenosa TaxID=2774145 RepID=A0AAW3ZDQ9_9GAMM|nr:cytochrome c3 family protein [Pseudomarimonas arenosa]MBD8524328.1 hypothetical protein [Pseudomarimonas arenosa]
MRWLVRRIHRKGKGQLSYEDDIHFGEQLTIGRAANQSLFLTDMRVALEHARVTALGNGQYRVESVIEAGIRVNGGIVHQINCGPGTQIEIGSHRIELIAAPEDYDAGVEISTIEKSEQEATAARKRLPTSLSETKLGKRMPAWILFVATLTLFLVLPLLSHYIAPLDAVLKSAPLPSRGAWEAGELASAHHFFGEDCQACHSEGFAWVKDKDCLTCHAQTPAHADPVAFNLPELGEARCAHCHRDHNGVAGLIRRDQSLCSDCHQGLQQSTAGKSQLADVSDFGSDHPPFQVSLPTWSKEGQLTMERVAMSPDLQEKSGIKFPHDIHLDAKGIASPAGDKVLVCASCHEPEPGGAAMKPVNFETMCQDCHKLSFDITEPEREVPHAKIDEIVYMLDEFYARRALEGEVTDQAAPESLRVRRRPGQSIEPQQRQLALAWARDKARSVGESLFTGRACTVCHSVSPGRQPGEWQVAPVRVAGVWFDKAHFTHRKHTTMECDSCHAAKESDSSRDLLIPDIANCRQCHAGEAGGHNMLESSCVSCHGYHESQHLLQVDL